MQAIVYNDRKRKAPEADEYAGWSQGKVREACIVSDKGANIGHCQVGAKEVSNQ